MIRYRLLLFFLLVSFLKGSSQYYDFSFEHLSSDQGLSNDIVSSIVKDKQGFMWFGTNDGLNRYDGRSFLVIRSEKDDTTGLPSNQISVMNVDKDGWIWITTARGLSKYDPTRNKFVRLPFPGNNGKKLITISNVVFTEDDYVWFISEKYLYKMQRNGVRYKRYEIPVKESYFSVYKDKKNRMWVYMRNGIYQFFEASGTFKYYGGMNSLNPTDPRVYGPPVITNSDTLFITDYGGGFYFLDETKDQFVKWKKSTHLVAFAIEDQTLSGRRFFWCRGGPTGLMIYDPQKDQYAEFLNNPRDPYTHNATDCNALFKDMESGIIWIGTKEGIEKYDIYSLRFKRKFLPAEISYGNFALIGDVIKDKMDPSGDTYWAGSWALGLFKWNRSRNAFSRFDMDNGLLHNEVFNISQSKNGYLIIGSREGITLFDPVKQRVIKKVKDFMKWPISRKVLIAREDLKGNIWMVANYDGVFEYDIKADSVKYWKLPGVAPEKGPYLLGNVHPDRHGRVWAVGFTGDIHIIDNNSGEIRVINNANRKGTHLPGPVTTLNINKETGEIWASGGGNYLAQLDEEGEVLRIIPERGGESGDGYHFILQDPLGYLWTNAGNYIQRVNPRDSTRDFFGKDDGLVSSSGIYGANITFDGELFLGFQFAFSHIDTRNIVFNLKKPRIAISSAKINYSNRYFGDSREFILHSKEKVITLEFAALNYSKPTQNRFAYKLEGYDKDWVYANDHDITLMNLEGGTHHLFVKASNNDGVWSDEMELEIKVIPPFHKTVWFKILMAILVGVLAYLVILYRNEQRKKLEQIRQRIATDLHDDMGSTLSSIRIFSDVAKKQVQEIKPETVQLLDRISNNATSLSENMQDIIWTIRNDNDTLDDLVSRMREFGLRVCDAKNIEFDVRITKNFKTSRLNLEQRRNLYMIFKEVINNAVKYSECSKINLFLTLRGRYLKMEVTDDGKGFDMAKVKRGNGLNNIEKRTKEINGKLVIESAPGEGTRIDILVVLKKTPLDA